MEKIDFSAPFHSSSELLPGQEISVTDLDFYALLRRQNSDGSLYFNQRRAVLFDVEAMGALRQQLVETLGHEMANGVLMRFGYSQGYKDANTLAETFNWKTEADWLAAGPTLHMLEGIVQVKVESLEFDRDAGHFNMQGTWHNSYEAEEHLSRFGKSNTPVCYSLTGYASGYASRFLGQEAIAIETKCVAKGDDHCAWEIRPLDGWGSEAEIYQKALQPIDILDKLEANRRLQKQTQHLTLLNQMSAELNQATSVDEVFKIAAAKANSIISGSSPSVALLNPEGDAFEVFALDDEKGAIPVGSKLPLEGTASGKTVRENRLINTVDITNSEFFEHRQLAQQGLRSTLSVPLIAGAHPIGTLNMGSKELNAYGPHDENVMLQMASLLASAVENRRLFEQTQNRAAELEENTAFLDSILDNIPAMIFVKEAKELRFVRRNKASEEMVGFKNEDMVGKNDYDFFPKEEASFFMAKDRETLNEGKLLDIPEEPIQTAGGEIRWVHTKKVPVVGSDGTPRFLLGISEDITERKQFEDELKKFRLGIERSDNAVFLTDVDGTITYVNVAFEKIYGFTAEEAIGQTPRILKSGLIPHEGYVHFWQTLLNKEVVAGEIVNKTKTGKLVDIEGTNNPIIDDNGNIIGFLAMHRDITERKQTAKALQESQHLYQSSIDGLPQNVYRIDRDGRIIFGNKTYLNTIGMTLEECFGKTAYDFFPKDLADKYTADDQTVMKTGENFSIVESHKVPSTDEMLYVQTVKIPVRDATGDVIGVQAIFWDITEQTYAKMALTKRAKELETVAVVSTAISTILDVDELLQTVTNLTKERFGLYHAHIYLLNPSGDTLNLAAGAGEIGRKMVNQGWSIGFNKTDSLVAKAAQTRQGLIVNDVKAEPGYLPNPMLPNTHSELVVPIIAGDKLFGVLDAQSEAVDHFTDEDVQIQTTLAAQVAVALQNATQYEQTQAVLKEVQESQELLRTVIDTTPDWIFVKDRQLRFQMVNRSFAETYNRTPEEYIGKDDVEMGAPVELAKGDPIKGTKGFLADDIEVMETGQPKIIETEPSTINGKDTFLSTIKTPLRNADGKIWGMLAITRDVTHREQMLTEAEDQVRRLAELNKMNQQLSEAANEQEVFEIAARQLAQIVTADRTSVAMLTAAGDSCRVLALHGEEGVIPTGVSLPLEGTAVGTTIKENRLIYTPDTQTTDWFDSRSLAKQGIGSSITAPLTVGGKTTGSLNLGSKQTHAYTPRDEGLALQAASLVASALENKRLLQQAQIRAQREQMLREVTTRIRGSADVDTVMRTAVQEVGRALGRQAFVYLENEENGKNTQPSTGEKEASDE